ncbi:peptide deformylase [Jeotgalibacillus proteolyticus]|uniref:Peptide deformylase n=1 Tax=Jeotgalibacillus proteolyticus TaxID=2082395 RepID=A0A2S5GH69_9BACL|nr:peptide deformylase [Jeotgalibacillus proteolyticus]PPA72203.1 peptide deformylase [Jeotgalibacillus proteolyticus]
MIKMEDIIREGHPTLRQVAKEVPLPPSEEDRKILKELLEYVINSQNTEVAEKYGLRPGIGLAAPQINISKRMFAVHLEDGPGRQHSYALFNPKVVSHSVEKTFLTSGEGCLSVDRNIPGYVPRYSRVTLTGFDIDGKPVKLRLKGLAAIAVQHELDHLNGVMFYDYINPNDPFFEPENSVPIER